MFSYSCLLLTLPYLLQAKHLSFGPPDPVEPEPVTLPTTTAAPIETTTLESSDIGIPACQAVVYGDLGEIHNCLNQKVALMIKKTPVPLRQKLMLIPGVTEILEKVSHSNVEFPRPAKATLTPIEVSSTASDSNYPETNAALTFEPAASPETSAVADPAPVSSQVSSSVSTSTYPTTDSAPSSPASTHYTTTLENIVADSAPSSIAFESSNNELSTSEAGTESETGKIRRSARSIKDNEIEESNGIIESIKSLFENRSLNFRVPKSAIAEFKNAVEEGRTKLKRKRIPNVTQLFEVLTVKLLDVLPIFVGFLILKAFIFGKISLIAAALMGLQKFSTGFAKVAEIAPQAAGGYYRRSTDEQLAAQNLAYAGQVPPQYSTQITQKVN